MHIYTNKKIGIWGFGVVGTSALTYFDAQGCSVIEILDKKEIQLPTTQTPTRTIIQTPETINNFLEQNDYILISPGIPVHAYQNYAHTFLNELDLLAADKKNSSIIAITGTVGKTSITHLLTTIIKNTFADTIAAGNIGYPMLNIINHEPSHAIIELSSFQLQPIKAFAPDLAIITNFFPNHLDHHQSIQEYFQAKLNIIRYQTADQQALLPFELIEQINTSIPCRKNWYYVAHHAPQQSDLLNFFAIAPTAIETCTIYYLKEKKIYRARYHRNQTSQENNPVIEAIFDTIPLPDITFPANWLLIVAACDRYGIARTSILPTVATITLPDHRVQKVGEHKGSIFYNDSKSTVWQATLQAAMTLIEQEKKPIKLFLGGLSKGADRTPLLQALCNQKIEIYAFGKEAEQIQALCEKFNIPCTADATLDASWQRCIHDLRGPSIVLFSPAGSSYDLFTDYQARGVYFTNLVKNYCMQP